MIRVFTILVCVASTYTAANAQEVVFDTVKFPVRAGEVVQSIDTAPQPAGDRKIVTVVYSTESQPSSRIALVGIKGTDAQDLFNPYRDTQEPYFTDIKTLSYKDKAVVSIRNVGPGGVDSIWITDGTTAGTQEIANIDPGPWPFIAGDSLVLITEDTAVNFVDLRNGAVTRIADATTGATGYGYLGEFGDGRKLFNAASSVYVTDGTVAGTRVIANLPSPHLSGLSAIVSEKNDPSPVRVVDLSEGVISGKYTFVTDGTVAGTRQIPSSAFKLGSSSFVNGYQFRGKVLYENTTAEHGRELWSLDLTTFEASILKDINVGPASSYKQSIFSSVNGKRFFIADDGIHGSELWVTDGTTDGTRLVKDIAPGKMPGVDYVLRPLSVGRYLIFTAQPQAGDEPRTYPQELWASDGTEDGTFRLEDSGVDGVNDSGVLLFSSSEAFGISPPDGGETRWMRGVFLRFFDPTLGPPTSDFLIVRSETGQPIDNASNLSNEGGHYYLKTGSIDPNITKPELLVAPRQLCGGADFKVVPGQCGCGVEELPADSSGGIVTSQAESDGSAVCMTPIGPIFIPATFSGAISGSLSQRAGQPDSLQLTIPVGFQTALQAVTTSPNVDLSSRGATGEFLTTKTSQRFKVQHNVGVVILDQRTKSVKKLPLRKTSKGTLKIKLSRRLNSKQRLTFQYAVGATRGEEQLVQTPYKKFGQIKVRRTQ